MICVSIGRGRHRHVMAEHRHLVEQGAELVELRLDYIKGEVNVRRLLHERPCPVIITCRRAREGGKFSGTEDERLMLLRSSIAAGAEYVDLEEDVAASVPRYGATRRIISYHDFRKTPDNLPRLHARLAAMDADIVKLATMANHPHDNLRMLSLIRDAKVSTIGLCMGDIGTPSRILAGHFGAPFTYATFHHERALAPGQLSYQHMKELYHYDDINSETALYGVIADPIGHSLSPQIHNAAFRHQGVNAVYIPFRVPRANLSQFIEDAKVLKIRGLSVTIPHKESIARSLTKIDSAAKGIEAVNTVVFDGDQVVGYNTDCKAALDSLKQALAEADAGAAEENPLAGKSALVLGAGGAARAIVYGLRRHDVQTTIASRTRQRADALATRYGARAVDWLSRNKVSADILINCTPVGMHPEVDATPYDKHYLKPSMLVFDTVYNPESTLLIKDAQRHHCHVVTGVQMFVRQASLQYRLFTGRQAPADVMRDVLKRTIGPVKY
ncbi:MAG: shikimate dehydrogenase [Pirellulales bacterium]